RICLASFDLTGTLDVSSFEDGTTLHFRATAVDVAGNQGALEWSITLDRVSLDIGLAPLTLTPRDRYTSAEQNAYSWLAHESIGSGAVRQGFRWRVALGADQSLRLLADGSVAVVDATPGSEADTSAEDPLPAADPDDGAGDDTFDPDNPAVDDPV